MPSRRQRAAGMRAHLEACCGAAAKRLGLPREACGHKKPRRAALARGQEKPARGRKIIDFGQAPDLADHRSWRAAPQGFLHRPEAFMRIARLDENELGRIETAIVKPRCIGLACLIGRLGFDDPDNGGFGFGFYAGRRGRKSRRQSKSKSRGSRPIARAQGDNLMQASGSKTILQDTIETAGHADVITSQSDMRRLVSLSPAFQRRPTPLGFEGGNLRAQKINSFRLGHRSASSWR